MQPSGKVDPNYQGSFVWLIDALVISVMMPLTRLYVEVSADFCCAGIAHRQGCRPIIPKQFQWPLVLLCGQQYSFVTYCSFFGYALNEKEYKKMDFLEQLSDNQMALVGCFAALACCSVLMTISYHFGRGRDRKTEETGSYSPTVPFTPSVSASTNEDAELVEGRRAA